MFIMSSFKSELYEKILSQPEINIDKAKQEIAKFKNRLSKELEFLNQCNLPGTFIDDEKREQLQKISKKEYFLNGKRLPYITKEEVENLSIAKGTLTSQERKIVENHTVMTDKILQHLPFPKHLSNVSLYASSHHEKLNGSGYPRGLFEAELSLQSKIMAVADIFEALTAKDRPYKKPMKLSQAIKILGFMEKDKHIDPEVLAIFMSKRLHLEYARVQMNPDQIDM